MSIIEDKLPILKDPASGLIVVTLFLSTILNVWSFQEWIELPKLITWLIGFGLILIVLFFDKKRVRFQYSTPVLWSLLGLGVVLLFSPLFSLDAINSVFGVYPRYTNSLIFFVSWIIFILIQGFFGKEEKLIFAKLLGFLGLLISLWAISQYFGVGYYGGLTEGVRAEVPSFLGNSNFSAMYVVATIPLQIWFLYTSKNKKQWFFYFISICLSLLALLMFNSRGAILALGFAMLGMGAIFLYLKKFKIGLLVLGALIISMFGYYSYYQVSRVDVPTSQASVSEETATVRLLVWDVAFSEIKKSPLVGTGMGNFFLAFRANSSSALTHSEWFDDAHNVLLQFFSNTGVPAGILLVLTLGLIIYWCIKYSIATKDGYPLVLVTAIITWLVVGSFTPVVLPDWLILAILLGSGMAYAPNLKEYNSGMKLKWVLLVVGIILLLIGVLALGSELALWQSGKAQEQKFSDLSEKFARISIALNPYNGNARLSLIRALDDQKKYDEVEKELNKLTQQHKYSSGLYRSASDYYSEIYDKTKDEKFKNLANESINSMLSNNSNYIEPLLSAAADYAVMKDYVNLEKVSRRAVVFDPKSYNAWVFLALAQYHLNDKQGIMYSLEQSFKLVPSHSSIPFLNAMKNAKDISTIPFPYKF